MRSERCKFGIILESKEGAITCTECEKVQDQICLLQNVKIEQDATCNLSDDEIFGESDVLRMGDIVDNQSVALKPNDTLPTKMIRPMLERRLDMLQGITVVDKLGTLVQKLLKIASISKTSVERMVQNFLTSDMALLKYMLVSPAIGKRQ